MDDKDRILGFIRMRGPSLPTTIAKEIQADSFFVSAHLSELKGQGRIKISHIKVGGGSPLYYLPGQESQLQNFSENLGEKERKVYELLKEKKVLRDSKLVPVFRAAIRSLKDFAFPFTVNYRGNKEIFWKWYLISNEEAEKTVRGILGMKAEKKKETEKKKAEKPEDTKEAAQEAAKKSSNFYGDVNEYFIQNKINVIEENIIRKNSDMEFIVDVPSAVGSLRYFVKAKSKKRVNDGDLSSVFIRAQTKRLPALFLGKGKLTKKAEEMLEKEFKGMQFKGV
ncbi:hypothetical protein GF323_07110 [Candidatus Woesearchaeota archaeon]|nr:hypothetical protein [Candidatus Woesearchaeota archaeon]